MNPKPHPVFRLEERLDHFGGTLKKLNQRVTALETTTGKSSRSWNVSVAIDWKMVAAIIFLILGLTGLLTTQDIKAYLSLMR